MGGTDPHLPRGTKKSRQGPRRGEKEERERPFLLSKYNWLRENLVGTRGEAFASLTGVGEGGPEKSWPSSSFLSIKRKEKESGIGRGKELGSGHTKKRKGREEREDLI